ncbi:MAG: 50S ribosomal protein L15 [Nanoarchaeota archaeon]|nr:50S ribosomal protein L15 [Nanoarchaeota archaeon]|tara:strand:+ start:11567 stop:12025 length:459 start_codon:yes stop_codon:yes gene_type:complete
MVTTKRKKVAKYRGHVTHGGGHRKKRRGAGNRGGRGNAGSGKRASTNKQSHGALGGSGFVPRGPKKKVRTINVSRLQSKLEMFVLNGKVEKKGDVFIVDLSKIGFDKLLGTGKISAVVEVTGNVSANAAEKVLKAGGKVVGEFVDAPESVSE